MNFVYIQSCLTTNIGNVLQLDPNSLQFIKCLKQENDFKQFVLLSLFVFFMSQLNDIEFYIFLCLPNTKYFIYLHSLPQPWSWLLMSLFSLSFLLGSLLFYQDGGSFRLSGVRQSVCHKVCLDYALTKGIQR